MPSVLPSCSCRHFEPAVEVPGGWFPMGQPSVSTSQTVDRPQLVRLPHDVEIQLDRRTRPSISLSACRAHASIAVAAAISLCADSWAAGLLRYPHLLLCTAMPGPPRPLTGDEPMASALRSDPCFEARRASTRQIVPPVRTTDVSYETGLETMRLCVRSN
jgi:hypothetical protein